MSSERVTGAAPEPLAMSVEPQGDWVGEFGGDGYVLAAWEGDSDLVWLEDAGATVALEQGRRYRWSSSTGSVRALQAPDASDRRAATYTHSSQLQVRLDFADGYAGMLRLYALDWDNHDRRQTVSVFDGAVVRSAELDTNFADGRWIEVPIDIAAGGAVTITVDKTAGPNVVLSGIFLGDEAT